MRALVDRFYDLMDLEPAYAGLRARASERRWTARATSCSGSSAAGSAARSHYIERFGHPMLRARHLPFAIGIAERDQWMACMQQAMAESGVDPALRERLAAAFFSTADWMVNRGVVKKLS